jgi:membrane fusion protein, multidrug efflux system
LPAPRERHRGARSLPLAIALAAALSSGCKKGEDKNAYVPPPPPEVTVANPTERDVVTYLSFTGVVAASEIVDLRARVQGFLEEIKFQPGQRVKKGDLLFLIDKRQYKAAVDHAEATVRARAAALVGAENDARLARELADQRAGPEIDALIKTARKEAMKADVAAAEASLAEARLNLDYCEIKAPIDGRITVNYVDAGNLVGRGEPTLLAQIVQSTPAYVSIDANENDVLAVRRAREKDDPGAKNEPGQIAPGKWRPCELSLAGETDFKHKGFVDYVDPQMNTQTGTLRVRTCYDNADEALLPGSFSRVRFAMSSQKAMLLPEAALLTDQLGRYALVVNDENKVEAKRVTIGALDQGMRVVEEGLDPDDRVVVLGVLKARPGSLVSPKAEEPAGKARKSADKAKKSAGGAKKSTNTKHEPAPAGE